MGSITTILHATDLAERSDNAFRVACALASEYGANLVIVHVVNRPLIVRDRNGIILPAAPSDEETLKDKLDGLEVPDQHVDVVRHLEQGSPAAEILRMAKVCNADLIVMGTHRRREMSRHLMGSIVEEVVRRATCPVLTITVPTEERASAHMPNYHSEEVDLALAVR